MAPREAESAVAQGQFRILIPRPRIIPKKTSSRGVPEGTTLRTCSHLSLSRAALLSLARRISEMNVTRTERIRTRFLLNKIGVLPRDVVSLIVAHFVASALIRTAMATRDGHAELVRDLLRWCAPYAAQYARMYSRLCWTMANAAIQIPGDEQVLPYPSILSTVRWLDIAQDDARMVVVRADAWGGITVLDVEWGDASGPDFLLLVHYNFHGSVRNTGVSWCEPNAVEMTYPPPPATCAIDTVLTNVFGDDLGVVTNSAFNTVNDDPLPPSDFRYLCHIETAHFLFRMMEENWTLFHTICQVTVTQVSPTEWVLGL